MAGEITLKAQIQSLRTAIEGQLLQADEQAPRTQLPWKAGERVSALVEALRPGDRALLRVGELLFDAKLPAGSVVGERLNLTFLSASPRATFALPDAEPAPASPNRAPVDISTAARNLNALVQAVTARQPDQPAAIRDPQPLLPAPPHDAAALAASMKTAVEGSGLFYESHLAQWAAGERPLALLLREPQARIAQPPPPPAPQLPQAAATQLPQPPAAQPAHAPPGLLAAPAPEEAATRVAPAPESGAQTRALPATQGLEHIDQRFTAQVRAQIESLDARQILWLGQAWPGQPLEWRIEEPPEDAAGREALPVWTSRLRITLPALGEIMAEMALAGGAVRLRLQAPEPGTRAALAAAQRELADALEQARLRLTGFSVDG